MKFSVNVINSRLGSRGLEEKYDNLLNEYGPGGREAFYDDIHALQSSVGYADTAKTTIASVISFLLVVKGSVEGILDDKKANQLSNWFELGAGILGGAATVYCKFISDTRGEALGHMQKVEELARSRNYFEANAATALLPAHPPAVVVDPQRGEPGELKPVV